MQDINIDATLKRAEEIFSRAANILRERYSECNSKGHQKPNTNNYCDYCHRHLKYTSKRVEDILEDRKNISSTEQPLDAARLNDLREGDLGMQKRIDWTSGLSKLVKELKL